MKLGRASFQHVYKANDLKSVHSLKYLQLMGIYVCYGQTPPAGLDALLFGSFCDRQLTKQVFSVCFKAAEKEANNYFGVNLYSTADSGEVKTDARPNGKQATAFTIVASDRVKVTCATSSTSSLVWSDLAIIPATFDDSFKVLSSGPIVVSNSVTGYNVSATFNKGATIVYNSDIYAKCAWMPAV